MLDPGRYAAPLATLTMRPPPRASMRGIAARQQRYTPRTFTSKTCHQSVRLDLPRVRLRTGHAGVADEQVERPELAFGALHHALDGCPVGDVGLHREAADLRGRLFHLLGGSGRNGHARACARELERDVAPDARARRP